MGRRGRGVWRWGTAVQRQRRHLEEEVDVRLECELDGGGVEGGDVGEAGVRLEDDVGTNHVRHRNEGVGILARDRGRSRNLGRLEVGRVAGLRWGALRGSGEARLTLARALCSLKLMLAAEKMRSHEATGSGTSSCAAARLPWVMR